MMKTLNTLTIAIVALAIGSNCFAAAGNPFGGSQSSSYVPPFSNAPSVAGNWTSGQETFSITQNGTDLVMTYNGVQHFGQIYDRDIGFLINNNGQTSLWLARLSADNQRIEGRDPNSQFVLQRRQGPAPGQRLVSIDSIRCIDLSQDTILNNSNQDNISIKVIADGRHVDTIQQRFTIADENGQAKRLGRQYRCSNSLQLEVSESGRVIGTIDVDVRGYGTSTTAVGTGIDRRFEWTQYEVTVSTNR